MVSQNPSLAGNFESAAQQMLDALHKASSELSQAVSDCIEQLSAYNLGLQQSLNEQLQQIQERLHAFIEQNGDELEKHKEKLLSRLQEFEQGQIGTIASAGSSVRDSLASHAARLKEDIAHLVEERLTELKELLKRPEEEIANISHSEVGALSERHREYQTRIEKAAASGEDLVTTRARDFEAELQKLVEGWKQSIAEKVELAQKDFQERNDLISSELERLAEEARTELKNNAAEVEMTLDVSIAGGRDKISSTFTGWQDEIDSTYESFLRVLKDKRGEVEKTMKSDLDHALTGGKQEISRLAAEAKEKVESSHKSFRAAFKRLEQDYQRRLDEQLSRFERTVSETLRRSSVSFSMHQRAARDLLEKLKNRLAARGSEMLTVLDKLSQQLEVEYSRSSQGTEERIDMISTTATEALEKQVQLMRNELKKISKVFQDELDELEAHVIDIELAGKKAAETVTTYRSAILSLGGD